jgi:hypothetical protein
VPCANARASHAPRAPPGAIAKDAEPLEELAGEYVARSFFSKTWQLRDAAVTWLTKQVSSGDLEGKRDVARTLVRTVLVRGEREPHACVCVGGGWQHGAG